MKTFGRDELKKKPSCVEQVPLGGVNVQGNDKKNTKND